MSETAHERYTRLARELGGYFLPWTRVLSGPDPELTFDWLLTEHLSPDVRVLEAGCGHGPDARRFGRDAASWTAYDFVSEMLEHARRNAPYARFIKWNGKGEVPEGLRGPFDLIVSRRGPTSVILRLPEVAAPGASFLYVGPHRHVPAVPERLQAVGWKVTGEWQVSMLAHAPTWEDWVKRCEFMGETPSRVEWEAQVSAQGMPYHEERHIVLARSGCS